MQESPQAKDLFFKALEISSAEARERYLEEVCSNDHGLRRRVEALLAAHDDPDSYLERPAARFDVAATLDGEDNGSGLSDSSSHHGRFLPGTKVANRYRIVSMLGRGGMGEVYRADDLKLDQTVALKFLPSELANDDKRLEYFNNEVRLARQISHPNVCRVYDIGEVDGQQFISMEYIDGEDLKGLLHRIGRLPKDKGIQIAQQLCAGLAAAHTKGVLHRDLKPANIMIDGQGHVRITDFGLATVSTNGENVVGMSGTPAYMAPEQLLLAKTNVRTDLYSLGLVLYELFTGQQAHAVGSLEDLKRHHEESSSPSDPGDLVPDLDPAIRRALVRCLSSDPDDRPRSVEELAMWLPGGDPLAAALAAGETPTPDMVAAAERNTKFTALRAYLGFAATLVGISLLFVISPKVWLLGKLDAVHPPAVLRNKAMELLTRFGFEEPIIDQAHGVTSPTVVSEINAHTAASNGYVDGLWFWYRSSPIVLASLSPFDAKARVSEAQPAWDAAGMNGVRLDLGGNLRWFRAVPADTSPQSVGSEVKAWEQWFNREAIGFELAELEEVESSVLPPDPFHIRKSWRGKVDALGAIEVTAAAWNGRPSFFTVDVLDAKPNTLDEHAATAFLSVHLVVFGIAFVLACRHLRAGRGDRRGAWSIAGLIAAIEMLGWVLGSHHSLSSHEQTVLWMAVGNALREGFQAAIFYLAIEPIIRRIWPSTLTTFSRVLRGEWNDPRVAEDVLMGICLGVGCGVFQSAVGAYSGLVFGVGEFHGLHYLGGRELLADVDLIVRRIVVISLAWLVGLVLLEKVLRSRKAAIIVWVLAFVPLFGIMSGTPKHLWALQVIPLLMVAYAYARHGVLGNAAMGCAITMFGLPLTLDANAAYFNNGIFVVGLVMCVSLYTLRNSLKPHGDQVALGNWR